MKVLKVSTDSKPASVAGALIATLEEEEGKVALQAIGAGAVNQAVKAVATARNFVSSDEVDLITIPAFADIDIDNEDRTAIRLIVETVDKKEKDNTQETIKSTETDNLEDTIESQQITDL